MKTRTVVLFFSAVLFSLIACSDDDQEKPTQEKIMGRWNFISTTYEYIRPSEPVESETISASEGDYFDFRTDTAFYYVMEGDEERSNEYRMIGDTEILIIGEGIYTIDELTSHRFIFSKNEEYDGLSQRTSFTLGR